MRETKIRPRDETYWRDLATLMRRSCDFDGLTAEEGLRKHDLAMEYERIADEIRDAKIIR